MCKQVLQTLHAYFSCDSLLIRARNKYAIVIKSPDRPRKEATFIKASDPEGPTLLINIPPELVLHIGEYLSEGCLARLLQTHSCLNILFKDILYRRHIERFGIQAAPATLYAARTGIMSTLELVLAARPENTFGNGRQFVPRDWHDVGLGLRTHPRPLAIAIQYGQTRIVQRLLQERIGDPNNDVVERYKRPLAWAAERANINIVKALLESDLTDPSRLQDPLRHAVHRPEILELLLEHHDIEPILPGPPLFRSSLFHAIRSGNAQSVWLICANLPSFFSLPKDYRSGMATLKQTLGSSKIVDIRGLYGVVHMMEVICWKLQCERHGFDFTLFGKYKIITSRELWIGEPKAELDRARLSGPEVREDIKRLEDQRGMAFGRLWRTLVSSAGGERDGVEAEGETYSRFFQKRELSAFPCYYSKSSLRMLKEEVLSPSKNPRNTFTLGKINRPSVRSRRRGWRS